MTNAIRDDVTIGGTLAVTGAVNKVTITPPATGATLTVANGKTLTASNTLTLAGTDGSTLNVGAGGTLGTGAFAPIPTTITGNAGSATVLQTARTINGVSFNGTANISVNATGGTPADLASTANLGASPLAARSDHVHKAPGATNTESALGANYTYTATPPTYQDIGLQVTLAEIGTYMIFAEVNVVLYSGYSGGYIRWLNSTSGGSIRDQLLRADNIQTDMLYTPYIRYTTTAANTVIKLQFAVSGTNSPQCIVRQASLLTAVLQTKT